MKNQLLRMPRMMPRPLWSPLGTACPPHTALAPRLARTLASAPSPIQSTEDLVKFKATYYKPSSPSELDPLREARSLYAKMHIHNWDLLVTEGDLVKLPVDLKDVKVGSKLVFDQVSQIGSRDHTLSGERIDPSVFELEGVVVEKSRVKRQVSEHTRRRRRHVRNQVHHNCLTVIRISKLAVN